MARKAPGFHIDKKTFDEAQKILDQIDMAARGSAITETMRTAGNLVKQSVRKLLPKPGYPGDKKDLKPLRDTIAVKTKSYQGGSFRVMIVGYAWPAGNHGHLVEYGHKKVLWGQRTDEMVPPHPYFERGVQQAQTQVHHTIIEGARKAAAKRS